MWARGTFSCWRSSGGLYCIWSSARFYSRLWPALQSAYGWEPDGWKVWGSILYLLGNRRSSGPLFRPGRFVSRGFRHWRDLKAPTAHVGRRLEIGGSHDWSRLYRRREAPG